MALLSSSSTEEHTAPPQVYLRRTSVQEGLRSVGLTRMRSQPCHCAAQAISHGSPEAEAMYGEILELIYKHSR